MAFGCDVMKGHNLFLVRWNAFPRSILTFVSSFGGHESSVEIIFLESGKEARGTKVTSAERSLKGAILNGREANLIMVGRSTSTKNKSRLSQGVSWVV